MSITLQAADRPLAQLYDVAMLDLDGVVYIGSEAVPGVPAALAAARRSGMRLAFVTNNAARPPRVVAEHLTELGVSADRSEVITSSQAAARYLADRLPAGSTVLVLGTTGLEEALREQELVPTFSVADDPAAVVQGFSPDIDWRLLAEGAVAINRGLPWVATNLDPTVPSPRGSLPGNGSLVAALRHATGAQPVATGKPDPTMHRETMIRTGAQRPIVVGDRLDTDIEGANAVGCASLLVLTGVTTAIDLLRATEKLRPTYVSLDVSGLLRSHPAPTVPPDGGAECGSFRVARVDGGWRLFGTREGAPHATVEAERATPPSQGSADDAGGDHVDALRALCVACWSALESRGEQDGDVVGRIEAARGDARAEQALTELGISRG